MRHQSLRVVAGISLHVLVVAGCSSSGGGDSGAVDNINLDEGNVTALLEDQTYELIPGGGAGAGSSVVSWRWSDRPVIEGALSECASLDDFDSERAARRLTAACTVSSRCALTFDQVAVGDSSRFSVQVPQLKADVGVRYRLEATDDNGAVSVGNFTFCLLSTNEAPQAQDDAFTVTEGIPLVITAGSPINLLTNDIDDIDVANEPLSVLVEPLSPPARADSFVLQNDGGFTYFYEGDSTVAGGTSFTDGFRYRITDGSFFSDATVQIRVTTVDDPPVLNAELEAQTAVVGVPFEFDVADAFVDPEGSDLFFSATGLPLSQTLEMSALGVLSGTPQSGDEGDFEIQVEATDQNNSAIGLFTLSIVANESPVAEQLPDVTVAFGELISIDTASFFSDPEQAELTFTLNTIPTTELQINPVSGLITGQIALAGDYLMTVTAEDSASNSVNSVFTLTQQAQPNRAPVFSGVIADQSVTIGDAINPVEGEFTDPDADTLSYEVSVLPAGLAFNQSTGVLSGTPGELGTTTLVITASDPDGLAVSSNSFNLTVTDVPNQPPVFTGTIADQSGTVGEPLAPFSGNFSDPEQEALTFSSTTLPAGLSINAATGVISGTPASETELVVTITATDAADASVSSNEFTITIDPAPDLPPSITGVDPSAQLTVQQEMTVEFEVSVDDESPATLDFTAVSDEPSIATVSAGGIAGQFTVTGESVGQAVITVTVEDDAGQQAEASVSVTVTAIPNDPPEITARSPAGTVNLEQDGQQQVNLTVVDESPATLAYAAQSSAPAVASVSVGAGGLFTISAVTPGSATIVLTVTDDQDESDSVSVPVVIDAPPDAPPQITARTPSTDLSLTEGDDQLVTLTVSDESLATLVFSGSSDNTAVASVVNSGDAYTITANGPGTAEITFTVSDAGGQSDSDSLVVTVGSANQAPVINGRVPADNTFTLAASGDTQVVTYTVTDESEPTLSYSATSDDTAVATVSNSDNVVTVTAVGSGQADITLTVTDDEGLSDTDTFTVVVDLAPQITARAPSTDLSLTEGDDQLVTLTVLDESLVTLVYSGSSDNTAVASVVNSGDAYTITANGPGTAEITFTVTDAGGQSDTDTVTVTVSGLNAPPEIEARSPAGALVLPEQGGAVDVTLTVTDEDPTSLIYTAQNSAPLIVDVVPAPGGAYSLVPLSAGDASVTFVVTDNGGLQDTELASVTIDPAPVITATDPDTLNLPVGSTADVLLTVTDNDIASLVFEADVETAQVAAAASNGAGSYTITALAAGATDVNFVVTDALGQSAGSLTTVNVTDSPPTIESVTPVQLALVVGDEASVVLSVLDELVDLLEFTSAVSDTGIVSIQNGNSQYDVTALSEGVTDLTLFVTDTAGQSDSVVVQVSVATVTI